MSIDIASSLTENILTYTPKVTVSIPTYNRPKELYECLTSLSQQTLDKRLFCIHISDNASEVNIKPVIELFKDLHIIYTRQKSNMGYMNNFAYVVSSCATPYCHVLCDDDWCDPGFLERALSNLEDKPNIAFYTASADYRKELDGGTLSIMRPPLLDLEHTCEKTGRILMYSREQVIAMCALRTPFFFGASLFRSRLLKSCFPIVMERKFFYSAEKVVYSKLTEHGNVLYDDCIGAFVRWNEDNISNKMNTNLKVEEFRQTTEWVLRYAFTHSIDVPYFWYEYFKHATLQQKIQLRQMMKRAFSTEEIGAIESGQFQVFNAFGSLYSADDQAGSMDETSAPQHDQPPKEGLFCSPHEEKGTSYRLHHPRARQMESCLAIFTPNIGTLSETFIKRHIQLLAPGRTVVLASGIYDKSWLECPLLEIPSSEGPARYSPEVESRVVDFLRKHGVTHILCQYGCYQTEIVELNDRLLKLPLFVHFYGGDASAMLRRRDMVDYYRWMGQVVSGVITVAKPMGRRLVELGIPAHKVQVAYLGVKIPEYPLASPRKQPCSFLAVMRLVAKKGPVYLLQAFARALEKVPEIRLDIIGDGFLATNTGPLRREVDEYILKSGLANKVIMHGARPFAYVQEIMARSSVFVQHSITDPETGDAEGLPVVIVEALAAGLPVISTRHEGIPEAVEDGVCGLLVDERDVEAMAECMVQLALNPDMREAMGRIGRRKVERQFNPDESIRRLRKIIGLSADGVAMKMERKAADAVLTWESVLSRSGIRLYAGDIPTMPEYEGWIGLSLNQRNSNHIQHDITSPFPLPDNSIDAFQAEDVFEHIPYEQLVGVINEIHRILKPGGLFRLSVPDYRCDVLNSRLVRDDSGNATFDPDGGGTRDNPGHLWFPRYETVKALMERSAFAVHGTVTFLHYYDENGIPVTGRIDYSKGFIQRTPDFDARVQQPYRPMSLVVDATKSYRQERHADNFRRDDSGRPLRERTGLFFDNPGLMMARSAATSGRNESSLSPSPRFTFIMIVLNGMPFVELALKAIYDEAHEIIVIEGAVEKCLFAAHPDGSSVDGTVEAIMSLPDPEQKIRLIQGRWPEKCEMQNQALKYVTGDYVWLVDSDEVYRREDIRKIRDLLLEDPGITQVNFIPDNFWKGFDHIFVSTQFFESPHHYRRLFRFVPGARFSSHRPPTMVWPGSSTTTEQMRLVDGLATRQMGIFPYHYSYVLDSQVQQKTELYRRYGWGGDWKVDLEQWYREFFIRWTPENRHELEKVYPIWTGDASSYSVPFKGTHPEVIQEFLSVNRAMTHKEQTPPPWYQVSQAVEEVLYKFLLVPCVMALQLGSDQVRDEHDEHYDYTKNTAELLGNRGRIVTVCPNGEGAGTYRDASNITRIHSDPISYLKKASASEQFHFVFLNSANRSPLLLEHFLLVSALVVQDGVVLLRAGGDRAKRSDLNGNEQEEESQVAHFLRESGVAYEIIESSAEHVRMIKVVFTAENRGRIMVGLARREYSQPADWRKESLGVSGDLRRGVRIAGKTAEACDLTQIQEGSAFESSLRQLILRTKPRKIIETGTYLGEGTTRIIAAALREARLEDTSFYSIECNPVHFFQAKENLSQRGLLSYVRLLLGLSVPRNLLPTVEDIHRETVEKVRERDVFVDHDEDDRANFYFRETDFMLLPDALLDICLAEFRGCPDIVLLDSAGHIGNMEFNHLIERLQGECYIILDDIRHIKHARSLEQIQGDDRFEVLTVSDEKFGFCIARFSPIQNRQKPVPCQRVLWVRTDSIGDNILAMSMLPHLKKRFAGSEITVLCQDHIAELYEKCPPVSRVLTFSRQRALHDADYRASILRDTRTPSVDLCLNTVFSREPLTDWFAVQCGATERVAHYGDLCNISPAERENNNSYYSQIITSEGSPKNELERHRDFLRAIGIETDRLDPTVWLAPADLEFAQEFFAQHGLDPASTIALFAGAQYEVRRYEHYGEALAAICRDNHMSVIALGSSGDYELTQKNLARAGCNAINLCGSTTLRQSAALLSRCRIAVGAETGLAHMACAVKTPNVILLGGGHFGRFMPYSSLTTAVCLPLHCFGCNWQCRYSRAHCIADVKPEVFREAIRWSLGSPSRTPRLFVQGAKIWEREPESPRWAKSYEWLSSTDLQVCFCG